MPSAGRTVGRFDAIQSFLAGERNLPSSLDFDLDRHHLAMVAWGAGHAVAVRQVADVLERPLLAVGVPDRETTWAWVSGRSPLTRARLDSLCGPGLGARVALGLDLPGAAGFRTSHRQAEGARRLSSEPGRQVVRYEDRAVEALVSEVPADVRAFVANELAGIEDATESSQRIRETLEAYFAAGHNASSAAAVLGVHQQTVANRLRRAEDRLGHPIASRRLELELALRIRGSLGLECLPGS